MNDVHQDGEALPDFSRIVKLLCQPPKHHQSSNKNKNNPKRRTAAVASALIEVIHETLPSNDNVVTPAALYTATLHALEATLSAGDSTESSPQYPLLEILQVTVPHVSSNLYQMQFSKTCRMIRGIISSIPSTNNEQSVVSMGWNALLRQCIRTSVTILNGILVCSSTKHEKEILKCFQSTIVQQFDDARPKVRKQAYASTIDLLRLSTSIKNSMIPEYLLQYINHILKTFCSSNNKKKEQEVRVLHLLSFLESSLETFPIKEQLSIGQELVNLITHCTTTTISTGDGGKSIYPILITNGAMVALLQILDQDTNDNNSTEQQDGFKAHAWTTLLPINIKSIINTTKDPACTGECLILYARCIVSIATRLFTTTTMQTVVLKLLPLSFTSIINCMVDTTTSSLVIQGLCAELARLIRSSTLAMILKDNNNIEYNQCIEGCITAVTKVVHHEFFSTWSSVLPCLASFVVVIVQQMIPPTSSTVRDDASVTKMQTRVQPILSKLLQLYDSIDRKPWKDVIESAFGIIVSGIGIELFLDMVKDDGGILTQNRVWILSVMLKSTVSPYRPQLQFFQSTILKFARECDAATNPTDTKSTAAEISIHKSRVVELWSLFPFFCRKPLDIEQSLAPLTKILVRAMSDIRYPQILPIICTGLNYLVSDTADVQENDLKSVSESSVKLLPALFKMVETLYGTNSKELETKNDNDEMKVDNDKGKKQRPLEDTQRVTSVTDTIAAYAPHAPMEFLKGLLRKIIQRLLLATQSDNDETDKICTLLGLAQAVVKSKSLDQEVSLLLLYRCIKPFIRSDEHNPRVQKRAYKVMAEMCQHYTAFFLNNIERLNETTDLMVGSVATLHVSARNMRLKCMNYIIVGLDKQNKVHMDLIPNIIGEVLLCLKDSNGKTRESAYELLLSMAKIRNDNMTDFFHIIVAALGAQTSHMRSAAVMALSRLTFEYAQEDLTVQKLLPSLLQTVAVLFDEQSREVIKSVVGFVRVSIAALDKEQLEPLLPITVGGLMKFNRGRGRFRSKIKIILKKLVKKYGYETITPLVPENDTRLLTHMRKLSERAARQKKGGNEAEDGGDDFDELMDSDENDSDAGRTLMTGVTGFTKLTGSASRKSLRSIAKKTSVNDMNKSYLSTKSTTSVNPRIDIQDEMNGDVIDMLDSTVNKRIRFMDNDGDSDFSEDDDEVMEFDDSGKLLVTEAFGDDDDEICDNQENDNDNEENEEILRARKKIRVSKFESAKIKRDEVHLKKSQKRKTKHSIVPALGSEYKSKKAGGDVKKKNQKLDPYAYVPLDGKSYTRKNRAKSVAQMATVVKSNRKRKTR